MKNDSIWKDNVDLGEIEELNKNLEVDVLIIGGGITGLSTAYHLINKDLKVALVEKRRIGLGITSKTTGKITFLQENIYSKLNKYHDEKTAKLYLDSQIEAINIIRNTIKQNKMKCDFYKVDSFLFTNDSNKIKLIKEEKEMLEKFSIKVNEYTELPNKDKVKYAISVSDTYVFHPLKYLSELKKILKKNNIPIYENTKVESIEKENNVFFCKTNFFSIKAKRVVLALHYPYFIFPFLTPFKTTLEKSYIGAKKCPSFLEFSAINTNKPTESIRYHKDKGNSYEINLMSSHNIAIKNNDPKNFENLVKSTNSNYDYMWSNIDIITNDYLPYIGKIDSNLLIGTGYNTWGMTNATLAGKVLSDIILDQENQYIELLNPKRSMNLAKIINFPIIIGSNIKSFIGSKINKNKSWYSDNVRFETRDGKNIAIYIDEEGKEHIVYNKCPHVKCSLIFNEVEKTWDCPCHGSRFDLDGRCIEGPSNYDICYKKDG